MIYAQRASRETPSASAIFTAFDTRQSPRFCIASSVRIGIPVSSDSFGIDMLFCVLSSFSFIFSTQGKGSAIPLIFLVLFWLFLADFTSRLLEKFQDFFRLVAFQKLDNQLEEKCKFFVRHIRLLISKMSKLYHIIMWCVNRETR